ncbi:hypothetical protein [Algivirga pacifica]|uniref:DUF4136 domain-containing protein n=1 Tax=Algivirga pacifica TaxID=1162670 RepID=A0ABP9DH01_9BACT
MRKILIGLLLILTISCQSQNQELEYRSVEFYFDQIAELEVNELIEQKVLIDSLTIADKYLDKETEGLNKEGAMKYMEARMIVYQSFFKDYLYQQHLEYGDNVYVLYFTIAGFDDVEWDIVKWNKSDWKNDDKLNRDKLKSDSSLTKIFWNYDEGPKNMENIRLFIENDYLVFERGNLYHSLYDLKSDSLLFNEESPWHASNGEDKNQMNEWIKTNLHDKIEEELKEKRK